ncbi:hypothetical protein Asal01_00497 [Fodinibius salicampi]
MVRFFGHVSDCYSDGRRYYFVREAQPETIFILHVLRCPTIYIVDSFV